MITLYWTDAATAMPDDDTLVLLAIEGESWPGYRDGDIWRYSDAMPVAGVQVTHWMHLPRAPGAAS